MNRLTYKTWAKITAFVTLSFLVVICLVVAVISYNNFPYSLAKSFSYFGVDEYSQSLIEDEISSEIHTLSSQILNDFLEETEPDIYEYARLSEQTGLYFTVYVDNEMFFQTYDSQPFSNYQETYYGAESPHDPNDYVNFDYRFYYDIQDYIEKNNVDESYYQKLAEEAINQRNMIIAFACAVVLVGLFLYVFLLVSAGRKEGVSGVHLNAFDKIPLDLLIFMYFFAFVFASAFRYYSYRFFYIDYDFLLIFTLFLFFVTFTTTFTARVKAGNWWKNTITYKLLVLVKNAFKFLLFNTKDSFKNPICVKVSAFFGIILLVQFFIAISNNPSFVTIILYPLIEVIIFASAIFFLRWIDKLKNQASKIAQGDFISKIDASKMLFDFKDFGNTLNNISDGMNIAVEEKMKSERLKTELITNVSHDIKTPLTSIINYVDLLKKEEHGNEKINEYLEVLDRQSLKLKKLITDLIDASKITSGNINVTLEQVELGVISEQIQGEYKEKFSDNNLDFIVEVPSENVNVLADANCLHRVFDNLLTNALNYSLSGTRVYFTVEENFESVIISVKNTSKDRLNIGVDELMERFVRGDSSRNTSGNGLGLSIAQSLLTIQNAKLSIVIDGDLFKVQVIFTKPNENLM